VQGMIAGDEKVLSEVPDDVKIIPGHGPLARSAEVYCRIERNFSRRGRRH